MISNWLLCTARCPSHRPAGSNRSCHLIRIMRKNFAPLLNRDFRWLWLGFLVSSMGNVFFEVGIMVTVYQRTGSALKTVAVTVASMLPGFVVGPFAGAWVDRYSRRAIMIAADLGSAVLVGTLLVADTSNLPLLYVVVVGLAIIGRCQQPHAAYATGGPRTRLCPLGRVHSSIGFRGSRCH